MVHLFVNGNLIQDINLVIFDKDGTIIDLHHYWGQMVKLRADYISMELNLSKDEKYGLMLALGYDDRINKLLKEGPVGLKSREVVLKAAVTYLENCGYHNTSSICSNIFNDVDKITIPMLKDLIQPIAGVREFMTTLYLKGCKIAVATNDLTERARLALEYLNFSELIHCIVGSDRVKVPKPDPETVSIILQKTNCNQVHTIIIGDSSTDVLMGNNAQCRASIGVLTGLTPLNDLLSLTPYVVQNVSNIQIIEENQIF